MVARQDHDCITVFVRLWFDSENDIEVRCESNQVEINKVTALVAQFISSKRKWATCTKGSVPLKPCKKNNRSLVK